MVLFVLSLIFVIGSSEARIAKASWFGRTVFYPFTSSLKTIESAAKMKQEISSLQRIVAEYTLKNLELQNQIKVFQNTSTVSFDNSITDFQIAEVIGYSGQFHERNLIVNKGRKHHVTVDSPVISSAGIIGKVILVSGAYSIILPFSNPQFQLPIMDRNTSVQGILQTGVSGTVTMNFIKLGSQISVGDTIVTSNLSRLFPKGFPVGSIARIKESQDNLFISAEITPFTLVENLEHVFILKPKEYNE